MSKNEPISIDPTAATYVNTNTRYTFDSLKLEELRKKSPWTEDPKWFNSVSVSPTALVKMMTHCHSGVEKGIQKGGNPIEVMGLMLGRPDPQTPRTLVVTDVFPLPIEGFETRVIADDQDVVNHMIALGESLENTRKEKFMGWYHSHPFDVGENSHCFLSQTDISTQLQWQRAEDPHGNPFLAVVVDPLRSIALSSPQIKAFRVYPPEYNSPVINECPDGSIISEEKIRLEKWGNCWSRYYELEVDYFMSNSARKVMEILTKNLWMKNFGTPASLEDDNIKRFPDRIASISNKIRKADVSSITANLQNPPPTVVGSSGGEIDTTVTSVAGLVSRERETTSSSNNAETMSNRHTKEIDDACDGLIDLAIEKLHEGVTQMVKKDLFS